MKEENIALLTIHDTLNYGSLLQTFSLYKAIESFGKNITLLNYKCMKIECRERPKKVKECQLIKEKIKSLIFYRILQKKRNNIWSFIRNNMQLSQEYSSETIGEADDIFSTFLVGSDIVWGLDITGDDFTYFLNFVSQGKRKLAFSSSIGTKWESQYFAQIRKLLSEFEEITTRESEAAQWIEEVVGRKVVETCDPTLLFDKNEWKRYVSNKLVPKKKYILIYRISSGRECIYAAKEYGKKNHLPVYYINFGVPISNIHDVRPLKVEEWLGLISQAEVVFTNSYHGMLFSLNFNRQFFYFNEVNKSRMDSLAAKLNIKYREGKEKNIVSDRLIDYSIINKNIEKFRLFSWERLRNMVLYGKRDILDDFIY